MPFNAMSALILVPEPPTAPSRLWLDAFAHELTALKPSIAVEAARHFALLAHGATWLLDPAEAARWWLDAMRMAGHRVPRLPRDLLG